MSYFLQNGDTFTPTPGRDSMLDTLPTGNYIVIETMTGLKFHRVESFGDPGRMYGNINTRAERILSTFLDRPRSTGVLLSGEKGSGKSQLARNVSRLGYEKGIPTILVNAPFHGDEFNALLGTIEQPAIILMDEFEKVYGQNEIQEQVLTLLDGVMTTQKLFILTVNDEYRVNHHMKNRPGRLFYSISFSGLEPEFVREYCEDNLNNKDEIENVMKVGAMFKAFNFDMLKAIVEEMNRYDEPAFDVLELLNAKPITDTDTATFEVVVFTPGGLRSSVGQCNDLPMGQQHNRVGAMVEFPEPVELPEDALTKLFKELGLDEEDMEDHNGPIGHHIVIESKHLKKVDVDAGRYEFVNEQGFRTVLTRKKSQPYSMYDYLG